MTAPILVIGQTGQLARALARTDKPIITIPRLALDLSSPPSYLMATLSALIDTHRPHGLINAAAYTQVDDAKSHRALAFQINADAPAAIAQVCAARDLPLVHISTDYVFAGAQDRPWRETDETAPINVYGESKLAGEDAVLSSTAKAAILRTSWVYDLVGRNFVTTMLRLADTHAQISVVSDQYGRPTQADVLANAALSTLGHEGVFHVSGTGEPVSWAGFAEAIFRYAGRDVTVLPIPSSGYATPAKRPAYSVLDTGRFEREIAALPDWRETLRTAFNQTG